MCCKYLSFNVLKTDFIIHYHTSISFNPSILCLSKCHTKPWLNKLKTWVSSSAPTSVTIMSCQFCLLSVSWISHTLPKFKPPPFLLWITGLPASNFNTFFLISTLEPHFSQSWKTNLIKSIPWIEQFHGSPLPSVRIKTLAWSLTANVLNLFHFPQPGMLLPLFRPSYRLLPCQAYASHPPCLPV